MGKNVTQMNKSFLQFTLYMIVLLFIASGCDKDYLITSHTFSKHEHSLLKANPSLHFLGEQLALPIKVEKGDFYAASGWIDEATIVYITELPHQMNVYTYDLFTGNSQLLYESKSPIISVEISPSGKYFLVHSSLSANEANIVVMNEVGEEIFSQDISSAELLFAWNPMEENTILLSSFTEDWEFSTFVLNIEKQALTELGLPQPFAYWIEKDQLVYLDWDMDNLSFFAPLKTFDLKTEKSELIHPSVFQVDSFGDYILVISVDDGQEEQARYTFYSQSFEEIYTFVIPHLSRYSDWLIPYYQYNKETNTFLTFAPLFHTDADVYGDRFELASYDLKTGKKAILLENMKNEPLSCLPNETSCLYGYYFEKLLNLETGEIIPLVESEKGLQ